MKDWNLSLSTPFRQKEKKTCVFIFGKGNKKNKNHMRFIAGMVHKVSPKMLGLLIPCICQPSTQTRCIEKKTWVKGSFPLSLESNSPRLLLYAKGFIPGSSRISKHSAKIGRFFVWWISSQIFPHTNFVKKLPGIPQIHQWSLFP